MSRRACEVQNANAQNSWVNNMRPTNAQTQVVECAPGGSIGDSTTMRTMWGVVEARFALQTSKRKEAQHRAVRPPAKSAARGGPTLTLPAQLGLSESDYWETVKRAAMAKLAQENIVHELEDKWNEPYADVMSKLDYGYVMAINYAMSLHQRNVGCDHQPQVLSGLFSAHCELLTCVLKPHNDGNNIILIVCGTSQRHTAQRRLLCAPRISHAH